MYQGKPKIILCGETIAFDKLLIKSLREIASVKILTNYFDLLALPLNKGEELILWELPEAKQRKLKAISSVNQLHPEIKIIIINGGASTKIAAEILKAGASDIFPKPFDQELLVDRVVALLRLGEEAK